MGVWWMPEDTYYNCMEHEEDLASAFKTLELNELYGKNLKGHLSIWVEERSHG